MAGYQFFSYLSTSLASPPKAKTVLIADITSSATVPAAAYDSTSLRAKVAST
jgi:hypothetical protein